jgi:cytoskeletal protein CcmA (bactofilin family)
MRPRPQLIALAIVCLAALAVAPATASAQNGQEQVVITGDVNVPRGKVVGDVVVADGDITVAGRVQGDVVAFSGPVRVAGTVDGTITAFANRITLLPGARVTGDVLYGDETPAIARNATVEGEVRNEGWSDVADFPWGVVGAVAWWLAVTLSTLVVGLVLLALAPRAAAAAFETARSSLGPVIGWGVGLFLGLPILAVIAVVTLVGIPLGVGLLLALIPLAWLGYVTSCYLLGRRIVKDPSRRYASFFAGWGILRVVALLPVLGVLAWLGAVMFGLGALFVTLWRTRRAGAEPATSAAPPAPAAS